jgi:uncharacterized protein YndB with AHSA1/START domain
MNPGAIPPLVLEHSFHATPEEVFDAWTNPVVLLRWWAMRPTQTTPGCEVDLRVGGRYLLQMRDGDDGTIYAVAGEYREVQRPHRLAFTWCWQGDGGLHPGHVSLVTVEFRADGDRTTVRLEHSELASEDSRNGHGAGWRGVFESLANRIFNDPSDTQPPREDDR